MKLITHSRNILGMRVDASNYGEVTAELVTQAKLRKSTYVCIANVHMCMEAYDDPDFKNIVNSADIVTSDGMPLVIGLRALGLKNAQRVYGPDLTLWMCEAAVKENLKIGLYGGTIESLNDFVQFLEKNYPKIQIACKISPPFRPLSKEEDINYTKEIADSGTQILFVGIGCPRQEKWMANHTKKLNLVMLGVGAAFDFHSGRVKQSPSWMQKLSLEWLYRLMAEPKRLWRRYLYHNPRFIYFFAIQFIRQQLKLNR